MKKKNPFTPLLVIPIMIILTIIFFHLSVYVDTQVLPNPDAVGHPAPATMLLVIPIMGIADIVAVLIAVIVMIVRLIRNKMNKE